MIICLFELPCPFKWTKWLEHFFCKYKPITILTIYACTNKQIQYSKSLTDEAIVECWLNDDNSIILALSDEDVDNIPDLSSFIPNCDNVINGGQADQDIAVEIMDGGQADKLILKI
jgi:hypothetical protein